MNLPRNHWRAATRRARPGPVSRATGTSAAAPYINPFLSDMIPNLWGALIWQFGRVVDYWLRHDSSTSTTITIVWVEGAEDEPISPGRYSRIKLIDTDLPRPPQAGDTVIRDDGTEYQVVRVDAWAVGASQAILQEAL